MSRQRDLALIFTVVCTLFFTTSSWAQGSKTQSDTPKFTSKTELVLVPVVVTDGHGHAIRDLRKEDFEVSENGKRRDVAAFDAPPATRPARKAPAAGAADFSNFDEPPGRRLAIIALDAQNTSMANQPFARDAVTRFLEAAATSADSIALVVLENGGFRVLHDFTPDTESLRRSVERVRLRSNLAPIQAGPAMQTGGQGQSRPLGAELPINEGAQQQIEAAGDPGSAAIEAVLKNLEQKTQQLQSEINERATGESMRSLAQTFGSIPGRKTLVWVSDAFARRKDMPVLAGPRVSAESGRGTDVNFFDTVFQDLNAANISVYPVDARGLVAFVPDGPRSMGPMGTIDAQIETMVWFAKETGGEAAFNRNDISNAVDNAFADSDATYLLSFRLPSDAKKGWHSLSVKVKRDGVHAEARKGFVVGDRGPKGEEEQLQAALRSPLPWTDLPVMARWRSIKPSGGNKKTVSVQIAVPPGELGMDLQDNNHVSVEVHALASDGAMKRAGEISRTLDAHLTPQSMASLNKGGFSFSGEMELGPGSYSVKIAVRDRITGRIGTIIAPLTID